MEMKMCVGGGSLEGNCPMHTSVALQKLSLNGEGESPDKLSRGLAIVGRWTWHLWI